MLSDPMRTRDFSLSTLILLLLILSSWEIPFIGNITLLHVCSSELQLTWATTISWLTPPDSGFLSCGLPGLTQEPRTTRLKRLLKCI